MLHSSPQSLHVSVMKIRPLNEPVQKGWSTTSWPTSSCAKAFISRLLRVWSFLETKTWSLVLDLMAGNSISGRQFAIADTAKAASSALECHCTVCGGKPANTASEVCLLHLQRACPLAYYNSHCEDPNCWLRKTIGAERTGFRGFPRASLKGLQNLERCSQFSHIIPSSILEDVNAGFPGADFEDIPTLWFPRVWDEASSATLQGSGPQVDLTSNILACFPEWINCWQTEAMWLRIMVADRRLQFAERSQKWHSIRTETNDTSMVLSTEWKYPEQLELTKTTSGQ